MSIEFMNKKFSQATGADRRNLGEQIEDDKRYLIESRMYHASDFTFLLSGFVPLHVAAMALRKAVSFHKVQKGEMS